jgi:hypothetical protein
MIIPFFRLPRELRDRVYAELFKQLIPTRLVITKPEGYAIFLDDAFPRTPLPEFCYTCPQIYEESIPMVLNHCEIVLEDVMGVKLLSDYLSCRQNLAFIPGIRSLTFGSAITWRPHSTHTNRALIEKCQSVRHIKIEIPASTCVEKSGGYLRVRQKKHTMEYIDLCCLMDCEMLEKVTLSCRGGAREAKNMSIALDAVFEPILLWVRHNICRGSGIKLVVEHVHRV